MTPEQLLEATTKALFRTCAFATCDFEHADEDIQESYRVHARAALRIAIEAAAKVAQGYLDQLGVPVTETQHQRAEAIAEVENDILALIPKEPTR